MMGDTDRLCLWAVSGRKDGVGLDVRIGTGGRGKVTPSVQLPRLCTMYNANTCLLASCTAGNNTYVQEITRTQQRRPPLVF